MTDRENVLSIIHYEVIDQNLVYTRAKDSGFVANPGVLTSDLFYGLHKAT